MSVINNNEGNSQESTDNEPPADPKETITREELLEMMKNQLEHYENLPDYIKDASPSNRDLAYFMTLIHNILIRGQ